MTSKTNLRLEVIIEENLRIKSIRVPLDDEYCMMNILIIHIFNSQQNTQVCTKMQVIVSFSRPQCYN